MGINIEQNIKKENNFILEKIKSKYIVTNIFDYTGIDNVKLKLFRYSKLFQNKFKLTINDYKLLYLKTYGINFDNYNLFNNINKSNIQDLIIKLKKFDLTINDIQSIIINKLKNKLKYGKEKFNDFQYNEYNNYF